MKKSFTLVITLFIILFVSFMFASFLSYNTHLANSQFHKDLAMVRGYWAAYGSKEVNLNTHDNIEFTYHSLGDVTNRVYIINGVRLNENQFTFNISNSNSIQDEDIFIRTLSIRNENKDEIVSYQ